MGDCRLKAKRLGGPKRLNRVLDARLADNAAGSDGLCCRQRRFVPPAATTELPNSPEGRHKTPLAESVPLEALPASRSLIVLHSCPFVRLVTANNATCRCAKDAMVTSKMARSTAHHRTF